MNSTYQFVSNFKKRLSTGNVTITEVRTHFDYLKNSKELVLAAVLETINEIPAHKRKRLATKKQMSEKYYSELLDNIAYSVKDTYMYDYFSSDIDSSKIRAIEEILDKATDEDIQIMKAKKNERMQEREKQRADIRNAIENPQSLQDFHIKMHCCDGDDSLLTPEQQDRYDLLYSLDRKAKRETEKKNDVEPVDAGKYTVTPDIDTRDQSPLWVVKLKERVEREEFKSIESYMYKMGGYYSRFKAGFIFKTDPTERLISGEVEEDPYKNLSGVERLRVVADNMQSAIDERRRDRKENTVRRADMAAGSRREADRLEQIQITMRNVADAIESGKVELINKINCRTQIEALERVINSAIYMFERANDTEFNGEIEVLRFAELPGSTVFIHQLRDLARMVQHRDGFKLIANRLLKSVREMQLTPEYFKHEGYMRIELTEQHKDCVRKIVKESNIQGIPYTIADNVDELGRLKRMGIESVEELRAYLREYWNYREGRRVKTIEDEIREKERKLIGCNIPGYFPTPSNVVERLIELADIQPGMIIVEGSAGKGNIADEVRDAYEDIDLRVLEINPTLREILEMKGHNVVGEDFFQYNEKCHRLVLNPPFEDGQDIDHVRHAFDLLLPGGKIVAVMSEGPYFRSTEKDRDFREWISELGGVDEKLPAGSFLDSDRSTGVSTRILVLTKEAAEYGNDKIAV